MTLARALGVAAAVLLLGPGTAVAASTSTATSTSLATSTATPTPTPSPTQVAVGSRVDPGQAVTLPVEDFTGPVEDLVFAQGSADGAVTDTGDRSFRLNSDVLFAFDKAKLTARAKREITRIAGVLKDGQQKPVTRVSVTGFTDEVGGTDYNRGLSRRRAEAVRKQLAPLLGDGVTVTSAGRGEDDPVATNKTAGGRKLNRRVEIRAGQ